MVVVLRGKREGFRGNLVYVSAALIIGLFLFGVAQDLPSLHDGVKLVLTGMAIRVFIGMVLEYKFFVLNLELSLSDSAGCFQDFIKVDFPIEPELREFDVDILLVL